MYNIYYTRKDGGSGVLMGLALPSVLLNVETMLALGDEITGIIESSKD